MRLGAVTGTAVSAQKSGLLPLKRFGITSHGQIAYHDYDGPGFRPEERTKFVTDLGDKRMMFLRNHATLTHDRSIAERSCEIQIAAQSGCRDPVLSSDDVIKKTVQIAQGVISPKSVSTRLSASSTGSILLAATKRISRGLSMTLIFWGVGAQALRITRDLPNARVVRK